MKRQQIRKLIALLSVLLFPVTIFYIAPLVIIEGAENGILTISLLSVIVISIVTFFIGRVYCGYACPVGATQELISRVNNSKARGGKFNWIKFAFAGFLLFGTITGILKVGGFKTFDPFFKTISGISISKPELYATYYSGITMFLVLALIFGRRAFCHYACPVAPFFILSKKIRKLLRVPAWGLIAKNKKNCKKCGRCEEACPMSLDIIEQIQNDATDDLECIACGECKDTCKNNVW